uniref:Polycystic kidney disease protein 1-like 1-like n=1 Tax=Neolamprologus brichardi TaxID=32507 RepID=A0A3Q4GJI1_NEOBR
MHSCRSRCTCSSLLFSRSLPLEASSSITVHPEFRSIVEARVRAVMLRAFVFFALHSLSALASSSGQQSSPWFIGCVSASSSLGFHGPTGVGARDLDPVASQDGSMALYRTEGPFLHNISVFTSPARLEAGKTFVIEVKGNLAGRILGLSSQALTYVTVESLGMTLKVNVTDDGSFTVSSDWILNVAGKYEISKFTRENLMSVRIFAARQAYPTNTDIIFQAVTDVPDPVFVWHFGDYTSATTTSRTITRKYLKPGRYNVSVIMSHGKMAVTSDMFPVVVQRTVKLNRLVHRASVLQNHTVVFSCRVNMGTDINFLWSFGDGTSRSGQSTERHIFHRTGEFRVEVTASNLVSSASLSSRIFVVDQPCQPPPVKNMGPLKLQVRRYEAVHLGVTYETEVDCDVSRGLRYSWTLCDSAGQAVLLPLTDTHRQILIVQSHLLEYDTYTATARVQVVGSVVYSNYSVKVQVMPSPPVAFIQGGTNIFLNNRNTIVTLDGQASYDPDFPTNPLSYSWACKPVSTITSSCFNQHIPTSSPVLKFPASFLKTNFDQFQFTLTVQSGERSASSETFLTVTSNLVGKLSIYCPECRGDRVNWDQSFSVGAVCEDCHIPAQHIQYTWSLFLVNASSKPFTEVPFCYTVDLSTMSAIMESPATSTLHLPVTNVSQNTQTTPYSSSSPVTVATFETRKAYHSVTKCDFFPHPAGLPESSPRVLNNDGVLYSDYLIQGDISSEISVEPDSSADWDFSFRVLESGNASGRLDYGAPFPNTEEGDPGMSAGRPRGEDGESFSAGDVLMFDMGLHKDEGSNLVDSKPFVAIQAPTLLDLPRNPLNRGLFESFTYTGISCSFLKIKPFSLRPRSRYMLEVTAKSQSRRVGRTQLFLQTNPVPEGLACQVQPVRGLELHTHFSIFCTSGKEDLVYEYSFSVGDRLPRTLYQGRDFQYYFSLPSGDPRDDYKVTIYTEIRSSTYGSATKPCPVTVQVQPSFLRDASSSSSHHDPDLELSESGLRNLSALVQLGNSVEIRNYISLLTSILNRLSLETEANTHAQTHMRTVLIRTLCELESSDQVSMTDNICILNDLLRVTSQVTLASAKRVTAHIQMMSEQFSASSAYRRYIINQKVLNTALTLLSRSLQVVTTCTFTPDITQEDSTADGNLRNDENTPNSTAVNSSTSGHIKQGSSPPAKQAVMLVADILQAASELMLVRQNTFKTISPQVSSSLINLYAASQNNTSTVINSGSVRVYMPASFIQILFLQHGPCVLTVLTELAHSPYTWANPTQLSGPVVDLSLYKCNTRRRIHVSSLIQPFNTELRHTQRNKSSSWEFTLLRSRVNYHSFNITQEHLLQSIQLNLVFRPTTKKAFPLMVLFRMFEKPTPRMHHLHKIYRCESNTSRITLPSSYLSAAGVGHLALLNADFGKAPRANHLTEEISYSLTVDSSLCLSWDGQQGAWTHQGCRTQLADTDSAVSCSCHRLRPLTVKQQQIQSIHSTADVNSFLSASTDLTVLGMLLLFVCLYFAGLAACKRADVVATQSQRVHYLSDNSASDPYLYAVTTRTGLSSAARMSAKVYISLYGEDGFSQTKELQVPGCTLFRRNSKETFILSAAESLGPVWGVHIWHDNSGPSPDWYLTQVEVSEVLRGHVVGCSWLFAAQCWLAASKGDGRVERMLRVCTQGINFAQMLRLKLNDYLADFHTWVSVYSCPSPSSFTHTERLSVCLLLLLGYACVGAVIVAQTDDQPLFALGFVDVSAGAVTNGLVSVVAVLPVATAVSFLFRLRAVQPTGSRVHRVKCRKTEKEYSEGKLPLCARKRREALIHKTLRDLSLSVVMLSLMMCITYDSSFRDHYQLNRAVRRHFVRNRDHSFMSIQKHAEWWNWSQTGLIESLYEHTSAKTEVSYDFKLQRDLKLQVAVLLLSCRSDSASKLKLLRSAGWLDRRTVALKVQFTLYSPTPNLFTSVTLLAERSPTGVLLPSVEVHSVRVHHTPTAWDYAVMVCKLLFLFLSLIQISCQVSSMGQQGLIGYWTTPCSWVEVGVPTATLVHYVCHIYHSAVIMSVAELLERNNHRGRVDICLPLQFLRTLRGIMLFLLTIKCVAVLRVNRTFATPAKLLARLFSSLLWPMISGVILLMASSCLGHLLHIQSSWAVSPIHVLLRTLPCVLYRGLRATSNNRGLLHSDCDVFTCGVLYLSAVVWTAVVHVSHIITFCLCGWLLCFVCVCTFPFFQAYYLEECESLVDELLFRLNALSDSLHLKAHRYREGSPVISPTPEPSNMDSQVNPSIYVSQANKDILQQRGQTGCNPSSNFVVASDDSLKGKKCPESAGKSQTTYTTSPPEVLVKVLVHEDPGRAVPDKH